MKPRLAIYSALAYLALLANSAGCSSFSPTPSKTDQADLARSTLASAPAPPPPTASPTAAPPPPLGISPLGGIGGDVEFAQVINGMLVVAQGPGRLILYDLLDPAHPSELATLAIPGRVTQMAGQGNCLFLLTESAIERIDISRPTHPEVVASLPLPARPDDLLLTENRAWIALSDVSEDQTRLVALDVTHPDQMIPLADLTVPQAPAGQARLVEGLLSITHSQPGRADNIRLYRWDQTGTITALPEIAIPAFRAWIIDGWLYIVDGNFQEENGQSILRRAFMTVYDITRPASPRRLARFDIRAFPIVAHRAGNLLYIGGQQGDSVFAGYWLQTFSLQDIRKPVPQISQSYPGEVHSLDVASGYSYIAAGSAGLQVMSNSFVRLVDLAGMRGRADTVQLIGRLALVFSTLPGEGSSQFSREADMVDVSNPESPKFVRSFPTSGAAESSADRLYIALPQGGVLVEDISQPSKPAFLGLIPVQAVASGIDVSGGIVYLATSEGLEAWQVADPAAPEMIGQYATDLPLAGVRMTASGLLAWGEQSGLYLFDVENAGNPVSRSYLPFPTSVAGSAWQVVLAGSRALLYTRAQQGTDGSGPSVFALADLSVPANPKLIGQLDGFQAIAIKVEGSLAFVLGQQAGTTKLLVIDPETSRASLSGSMATPSLECLPDLALGLGITGQKAIVLSGAGTATVLDTSNPASPRCESTVETAGPGQGGELRDMAANSEWALVAAGLDGLEIWRLAAPSAPAR
jgi:hypothetical protein